MTTTEIPTAQPTTPTAEYINSVRECAIARKRTMFIYRDPTTGVWVSSIHFEPAIHLECYMHVTKYGSAYWVAENP